MDSEPVQHSMLSWMLSSLGAFYVLVLPLAGLVCFIATLIIVIRGKGPMASAAVVLIAPIPFLFGIFGGIQRTFSFYQVIAMSGQPLTPADLAFGISADLLVPLVGLMLMTPAYITAVVGALIRSLVSNARPADG